MCSKVNKKHLGLFYGGKSIWLLNKLSKYIILGLKFVEHFIMFSITKS